MRKCDTRNPLQDELLPLADGQQETACLHYVKTDKEPVKDILVKDLQKTDDAVKAAQNELILVDLEVAAAGPGDSVEGSHRVIAAKHK